MAVLAALPCLVAPQRTHAQQTAQPQIRVDPRIVGKPRSQIPLRIEIRPADALPKKAFVSIRGLPSNVSLTAGQPIAPGSWAVSVSDLAVLKADIPAGLSGQADIVISLIALDGRMLAQTRTTLVLEPFATTPPAAGGGRAEKSPPERAEARVASRPLPTPQAATEPTKAPAPAPNPPVLSAAEKERAERALALGEQYLARGSIQVTRQYFQLAADAGLAAAALRLAATYDPGELQRLAVPGVIPDSDLARKWYERARELGAREAEAALARLSGN